MQLKSDPTTFRHHHPSKDNVFDLCLLTYDNVPRLIKMCRETAFKSFPIVFDWLFGCIKSDRGQFGRQGKAGDFYLLSLLFFYLACSCFCSVIASLFQTTPVWPSYFLSLVHNHSSISPHSPSNSPLILFLSLPCLLHYHRRIHSHSFFVSGSSTKSLCMLSCLCYAVCLRTSPSLFCHFGLSLSDYK